jgi:hypothetical protein
LSESQTSRVELNLADAWALAEVFRHRVPCATDCEYCSGTGFGYVLAMKVQRAILNLKKGYPKDEIRITLEEAWTVYRYLPRTAYDGAEALLLQVFKIIVTSDDLTELPPWVDDLDLGGV